MDNKTWRPIDFHWKRSFSNISYADAWAIGMEQEKLMSKIMSLPKIKETWDSDFVMQEMLKMC